VTQSLDLAGLTDDERATGVWAAALLHALAREEAAGRRPQRLTEPKLDTWTRFRGRLTSADFVALLFEDAAVIYGVPFDPSALGGSTRPLQPFADHQRITYGRRKTNALNVATAKGSDPFQERR
jgi:hypothetical protein